MGVTNSPQSYKTQPDQLITFWTAEAESERQYP